MNQALKIFFLSFAFFSFSIAKAAQVSKVNQTQAIVELQGEPAEIGGEFYSLNADGKKVSLLVVKQVKGDRALMLIKKGKATVGDSVQAKAAVSKSASAEKRKLRKRTPLSGGLLASYAMSTMSMSVQVGTVKEDVKMSNSSFGLKAYLDYDLSPTITVRGATGYETFATKGTITQSLCDGTTNCQANYNYLPLEGSAHYNFMTGNTRAWVGLGYSFLIEMSKSVNIPNLNAENKTNQMILFSLGADIRSGATNFIPIVVEYAMFPGSTNVVASAIYVRAGYGFSF